MDDTEMENQHLLHNEKQRERYARKRKEMMDAKIFNQQKFEGNISNQGIIRVSQQYRPSKVENEQQFSTTYINFHFENNDMHQISPNQIEYTSCQAKEMD